MTTSHISDKPSRHKRNSLLNQSLPVKNGLNRVPLSARRRVHFLLIGKQARVGGTTKGPNYKKHMSSFVTRAFLTLFSPDAHRNGSPGGGGCNPGVYGGCCDDDGPRA